MIYVGELEGSLNKVVQERGDCDMCLKNFSCFFLHAIRISDTNMRVQGKGKLFIWRLTPWIKGSPLTELKAHRGVTQRLKEIATFLSRPWHKNLTRDLPTPTFGVQWPNMHVHSDEEILGAMKE